jgi:hypothetical protein
LKRFLKEANEKKLSELKGCILKDITGQNRIKYGWDMKEIFELTVVRP